jgi:hypothetical protein
VTFECAAVAKVITHVGVGCLDVSDLLQLRKGRRSRASGKQAHEESRNVSRSHYFGAGGS